MLSLFNRPITPCILNVFFIMKRSTGNTLRFPSHACVMTLKTQENPALRYKQKKTKCTICLRCTFTQRNTAKHKRRIMDELQKKRLHFFVAAVTNWKHYILSALQAGTLTKVKKNLSSFISKIFNSNRKGIKE